RSGPRGDREVARLAVARHTHAHLGVRFDVAHDAHHLTRRLLVLQLGPVHRHDHVADVNPGFRGRSPRTHLAHARARSARGGLELHPNDGVTGFKGHDTI